MTARTGAKSCVLRRLWEWYSWSRI